MSDLDVTEVVSFQLSSTFGHGHHAHPACARPSASSSSASTSTSTSTTISTSTRLASAGPTTSTPLIAPLQSAAFSSSSTRHRRTPTRLDVLTTSQQEAIAAIDGPRDASSSRPPVPVAAAIGAPGATDYSKFVDSTDEPDLSQRKLEHKNEKCQYFNCPNRARVSQAYGKFCNRHVIVAPCGFPGCRDKAMTNTSMCEKHLAEGKEALHRVLAARAQNVPVCRTFGCFKNDQGRGYCRGHEKLLMATGRLPTHINKRRLNSAYTMCSYPDCNKHSQRNHLCRTHGNVVQQQAQELAKRSTESFETILARLQKEIRRCTHPTCTKNSQRDRLCTLHYYEKSQRRDQTSGSPNANDSKSTSTSSNNNKATGSCSIQDCGAPALDAGLCRFHGLHRSGTTPPSGGGSSPAEDSDEVDEPPDEDLNEADEFETNRAVSTAEDVKVAMERPPMDTVIANPYGPTPAGRLARLTVEGSPNSGRHVNEACTSSRQCGNPMCFRMATAHEYCDTCRQAFVSSAGDLGGSCSEMPVQRNAFVSSQPNAVELGGYKWPDLQSDRSRAICLADGCGTPMLQQGYCGRHLQLGSDAPRSFYGGRNRGLQVFACAVDGCHNQAQLRGLCVRHFRLEETGITRRTSGNERPMQLVGGDSMLTPFGGGSGMHLNSPYHRGQALDAYHPKPSIGSGGSEMSESSFRLPSVVFGMDGDDASNNMS
ncbi:hypothetical protein PINS_up000218 [Pythium insidiosum]|nr:hypothetical protein PINS_up000218 [Pythium insidiosum]